MQLMGWAQKVSQRCAESPPRPCDVTRDTPVTTDLALWPVAVCPLRSRPQQSQISTDV